MFMCAFHLKVGALVLIKFFFLYMHEKVMGYLEMSYAFLEIKMAAAQKPALVFFVRHVCS